MATSARPRQTTAALLDLDLVRSRPKRRRLGRD
ncbi:hypothetical protein Patl1_20943 [Pistacia atlantica]|uniref:Uncharacterized protein n=1 Tax=Pistacia atlantica TaxID=434234 RepID=A0ACC1BNT2_9ROSI|nr:hypothetical protein Patl1_20943 [Pistacia atlantica]